MLLQVMSLAPGAGVVSLLDEAWRLQPFAPPFAFSAFFSPEDTLLCVCAADSARLLLVQAGTERHTTENGFRYAELTSGSGLVGLYLLGRDTNSRLFGLDIDDEAAGVATRNALTMGLADRAQFTRADLWSTATLQLLEADKPQLMICNPPYVPEPPGTRMQIEAGAGPNGTAHVMRALELTRSVQPDAFALSWCSLAHPGAVVAAAESSGYELSTLFVSAIADGEYSGSVHSYLRDLPDCFINEQPDTLKIIASDGSARFSYLLLAGAFTRRSASDVRPASDAVQKICTDFARDGIPTLATARAPFELHCSVLNRWDELKLRVLLHGDVSHPTRDGE
jgi:hypothetical protein